MNKVICCFLACYGLLLPIAHTQNVQLEVLNSAQGLSQGMIYDIVQDHNGFIWFATRGGLNRYDGYSFKAWKNDPFNPYSISDNTIQVLLEDRRGWLWLGTENNGIDVFDPQTGRFFHLGAGEGSLSNEDVLSLAEAPDGSIWVGTNNGLNRVKVDRLPPHTANLDGIARVEQFFWEPKNTPDVTANYYESLLCTPQGILWVGTSQQVYRYQILTGKRELIPCKELNPPGGRQTNSFAQGPDGSVWLGQSRRIIQFKDDKMNVFSFPASNQPFRTYLTFDQNGNLYVGRRKFVYLFTQEALAQNQPIEPRIFCDFPAIGVIGSTQLFCDRNGLIWMGTNGYGVRKYNLVNQNFQHFLKGISTRRLIADRAGQLWAWDASVIKRVDQQTKNSAEGFLPGSDFFNHDLLQTQDSSYWFLGEFRSNSTKGQLIRKNSKKELIQAYPSPISLSIYSQLLEDREGNIWIFGPESNIARFDVKTQQFSTFGFEAITGFKEASLAMLQDPNGHFWIGTPHGLLHGILKSSGKMQFASYHCKPEDPSSLSSNVILSLCNDPVDPKRFIWVGTRGGGLNLLDKKTGKCKHFTINHGLPDDVIYGILPDERGNLWLSTNSGLSKFNPKTGHFENYSVADGLQDNEFNTVSHAKGYDGRLFFGGVNGVTAFFPEKISPQVKAPTVFITALRTNNKIAAPGDGILSKAIEYTQVVRIPYAQNQLGLEFVAMDYTVPAKNQFRYRLKGADKTWVESTTSHSVNYSNLAPGRYEFEVSSGGAHGVWSASANRKLIIQVLPPWWRSPLAYVLYVLLVVYGAYQFIRWRVRQHEAKSQREFEKREMERIQALEQLKSNFFTNITHELRTPLTLVIEPLRQILNQPAAENWLSKIQLAERNGSRLLQLVNQLLDLAKLEGGAMPLELHWGSIDDALNQIATAFAAPALRKNLRFELKASQPPLGEVAFDRDKLEKIVNNLLSNALKYTPEGGLVSLQWYAEQENEIQLLKVEVKDTGPGIPLQYQTHIFERFYTLDQTAPDGQASTGVGLSLSKELAEIMGGQIEVENNPGGGALFRLSLPLQTTLEVQKRADLVEMIMPLAKMEDQNAQQLLVLVVEDNAELRNFLVQTLQSQYRVMGAEHGKAALNLAREHTPDIIISDLAMPEMDGFELLQQLKKDLATSHIPVMLLTAKASLESRLTGLHFGAEAYLQKPFHTEEVFAWIQTLLKNRQQLQLRFAGKEKTDREFPTGTASTPEFSPLDQEFLQRLEQVIRQEMENEDLNVEDLARLMFLSRSQLHRKVIALTGLSSTEFMRKLRLDYALHLLTTEGGKITEIAQRVGFRNVKYFSTVFKEHFGKSPSEI